MSACDCDYAGQFGSHYPGCASGHGGRFRIGHIVRVGQVWQDKDSRTPNLVTVLKVENGRAQIQRPSRKVWVRTGRLQRRFSFIAERFK